MEWKFCFWKIIIIRVKIGQIPTKTGKKQSAVPPVGCVSAPTCGWSGWWCRTPCWRRRSWAGPPPPRSRRSSCSGRGWSWTQGSLHACTWHTAHNLSPGLRWGELGDMDMKNVKYDNYEVFQFRRWKIYPNITVPVLRTQYACTGRMVDKMTGHKQTKF